MNTQKQTAHCLTDAPLKNDTPSAKGVKAIKVSCFDGAKTNTPRKEVTIGYVLEAIRTGGKDETLRHQVEAIRDKLRYGQGNAKEVGQALKQQLPAVTFSGTFTERKNGALKEHSGLLCADIDDLNGELPAVKSKLAQSPYVVAVFGSPSGEGLKAIVRVPADAAQHAGSFRAIEQHVKELTGAQIDQACKDPARLCFLSYDPEPFVNEDATELQPLPEPEKPRPLSNREIDLNERQRIAREILGEVDWQSATSGFVTCPGKYLHTNGNGARDCKIELDNVPTVHCFHNSCRGIIEGVNHALRSRVSKAEFTPGKVASPGNTPGTRQDSPNSVDVDAGALSPAPKPYTSPPLDLLPEKLQDYLRAAADSINVDVSFVFLPMLSSLGSAIGNARSILLKPGFIQPPVIWTGIIGRSGSRKSPALQKACFAVLDHEKELSRQNRDATTAYEERLSEWESAKRAERGIKPQPPTQLTCLMDDMTLEALADALQTNPRGVLVKKDELSHWFCSFDQYTNAKGSDVSRWLQLHTAVFFGVDRRSDHRRYRIYDPRVCITGGIQPQVLKRILTPEFFEQGLAARFLLASPQERPDKWSKNITPDEVIQTARELFEELWLLQPDKDEHDSPCPYLLRLSEDSEAVFAAFYDECGTASMQYDEREEAAYNKLTAYAARLALVGQIAQDPQSNSVTGEVMQAACNLARWFGNEAVRIYATLSETREQREQRQLEEFIRRRGCGVTVRDVMQAYWPLKNQKEKTEAALNGLVLAGRGKWKQVPHVGAGRPARKFQIEPTSTSTQFSISPSVRAHSVDVDAPNSLQTTGSGESQTALGEAQDTTNNGEYCDAEPVKNSDDLAGLRGRLQEPERPECFMGQDGRPCLRWSDRSWTFADEGVSMTATTSISRPCSPASAF